MEAVMVSGQELFLGREKIKNSLSASLIRAYDNGIQYAEKTRSYRILLRQTMLQLEADGAKATTLKDIAKGADDVAQAEFEMMVAEVSYKASNENIMAQKKLFDSIEADIKREYYKGE
jgi:hypothetical protein